MGQKERRAKAFSYAADKSMAEMGFPDRQSVGDHEQVRNGEQRSARKPRKRKYGMSTLSFEESSGSKSGRRPRELKIKKPIALRNQRARLSTSKDSNVPADIVDPIATPVFSTPRIPAKGRGVNIEPAYPQNTSKDRSEHLNSESIKPFSDRSCGIDPRLVTGERNEYVQPSKQRFLVPDPLPDPPVCRRIDLSSSAKCKRKRSQSPPDVAIASVVHGDTPNAEVGSENRHHGSGEVEHGLENSGGLLSNHILLTMESLVPRDSTLRESASASGVLKETQADKKTANLDVSRENIETPRKTLQFDGESQTPRKPHRTEPPFEKHDVSEGQPAITSSVAQANDRNSPSFVMERQEENLMDLNPKSPVASCDKAQVQKRVRSPPLLRISETPISSSEEVKGSDAKSNGTPESRNPENEYIFNASQYDLSNDGGSPAGDSVEVQSQEEPTNKDLRNVIGGERPVETVIPETPMKEDEDELDNETEPPTPEVQPAPSQELVRYVSVRVPCRSSLVHVPAGALRSPSTPASSAEE